MKPTIIKVQQPNETWDLTSEQKDLKLIEYISGMPISTLNSFHIKCQESRVYSLKQTIDNTKLKPARVIYSLPDTEDERLNKVMDKLIENEMRPNIRDKLKEKLVLEIEQLHKLDEAKSILVNLLKEFNKFSNWLDEKLYLKEQVLYQLETERDKSKLELLNTENALKELKERFDNEVCVLNTKYNALRKQKEDLQKIERILQRTKTERAMELMNPEIKDKEYQKKCLKIWESTIDKYTREEEEFFKSHPTYKSEIYKLEWEHEVRNQMKQKYEADVNIIKNKLDKLNQEYQEKEEEILPLKQKIEDYKAIAKGDRLKKVYEYLRKDILECKG